jgi:hypothetical protein
MTVLIVAALAALAQPIAGPQAQEIQPAKAQADEPAGRIKDLQKERIATLKELVDQAAAGFKTARVSYEEVLEAQLLLLKAELDAAEKESERITLYERTVEVLNQSEKVASSRAQTGRGSQAAVLKIKARRLEAEIELERAKAREGKGGK